MKAKLFLIISILYFAVPVFSSSQEVNLVGPESLSPQKRAYEFEFESNSAEHAFIELSQGNGNDIDIPNCRGLSSFRKIFCYFKKKWVFFKATWERPFWVEVKLNNKKTISKKEFNWSKGRLVKEIRLQELNKLKVKVRGHFSSSVNIRIYKTIVGVPPVANFSFTPDATIARTFVFDGSSSTDNGQIVSYAWDFGDGQSGQGAQINHTYNQDGTFQATLTVTDDVGLSDSFSGSVDVISNNPPVAQITSNVSSGEVPLMVTFDGSSSTDSDGDPLSYLWDFGNGQTSTEIMPATLFNNIGNYQVQLTVTDSQGASASASISIDVTPVILPPDPSTIAPSLPFGQSGGLQNSLSFLYINNPPVVRNVVASSINPQLTSWIRGRVLDKSDQPLSGVKVSILGHPEYGYTYSRPDGMYDLVVNGGMTYTLKFSSSSVLPLQRRVETKILNSHIVDDVVMTGLDPKVLVMTNNSAQPQFFSGSTSVDVDGTRTGRMYIPANTSGEIVLSNGSRVSVPNLDIRITEYTVGDNGLQAMPGTLPPTTDYTYAMELSVDQAIGLGSDRVEFNQPVSYYVDNFVNAPIGALVPFGFYNLDMGRWESKKNGVVLSVISINNGEATLDIDGSGQPNLVLEAAFGITAIEKQLLSQNYSVGDSFWRVQVDHFSPYDANYLNNFPNNLGDGDYIAENPPNNDQRTCQMGGSFFEYETQTFGERLPVHGTPFNLTYKSDRTPGYKANSRVEIDFSSRFSANTAFVSASLSVAGTGSKRVFSSYNSANGTFEWDGLDAFGRLTKGLQKAEITLGNIAESPSYVVKLADNNLVGVSLFNLYYAPDLMIPARQTGELTLVSKYDVFLGVLDWRDQGFGGWSLDIHHSFNPTAMRLYRGDGSVRIEQTDHINPVIQNCFLREGGCTAKLSGSPAISVDLGTPHHMKYLGDGRLLVGENSGGRNSLFIINDDQSLTVLVSQGTDSTSENIASNQVMIEKLGGLEQLPNGEIIFADKNRVRKISATGVVTTIAGDINLTTDSGDSGPASQAGFAEIRDLAVSADGSVFIATSKTVRRIAPDGIVETYAGRVVSPSKVFPADLLFARDVDFGAIQAIDTDSEGMLYIADNDSAMIVKVQPDGYIQIALGANFPGFDVGDNGPARDAGASSFSDLRVDSQKNIYFSQSSTNISTGVIRKIDSNDFIATFVGIPQQANSPTENNVAGIPTLDYKASGIFSLAIDPNDVLALGERRKVSRAQNLFAIATGQGGFRIPSSDGDEIFVFDDTGRHLETLHAMTRAIKYKFNYQNDLISSVEDGDGKVTTIVRDGLGNIEKIVSHYGVETIFSTTNGYITQMTTPENESYSFQYEPSGLLTRIDKPDGASTVATYSPDGFLRSDIDAEGGSFFLTNSNSTTQISTGEGRSSSVNTEYSSQNSITTNYTAESGLLTQTISNGQSVSSDTTGISKYTQTMQRDPFLPAGFISEDLTIQDSSVNYRMYRSRSLSYDDPLNPATSEFTMTDTYTLRSLSNNPDHVTTEVYSSVNNETTTTTPEGRVYKTQTDDQGRTTLVDINGINNINMAYDSDGRLATISQGGRVTQFSYDSLGYLSEVTNALNQTTRFTNDANGRVTKQTLADGREIDFRYDGRGNLTGIKPAGKNWHEMDYNLQNLLVAYRPPTLSGVVTNTTYAYNSDKDLIGVMRADGKNISYGVNAKRQLSSITTDSGTTTFTYTSNTQQLASVTSEDGIDMSLSYSGERISRYNWPAFGNVSINFDQRGNRTSDSTGSALFYDGDYLPIGNSPNSNGTINFTFNPQNQLLEQVTYSNLSNTDTYSYNAFGEMTEHKITSLQGVSSFNYTRDGLGRILSATDVFSSGTESKSYTYDLTGRLIEATDGRGLTSYTYDSNNNIQQVNGPDGLMTASYDEQDRLLTFGVHSYTYNAYGELATKTNTTNQEATSYTYDSFGNLKEVDLPSGNKIEYQVDGFNRRISRSNDGGVTQDIYFYRDQLNIGRWKRASDGQNIYFSYASKSHVPDLMFVGSQISSQRYRIITDHLGSVREVRDTQGNIVQAITYDAYGKVLTDTNPGFQPFGYAGGLYDHQTGLVRFGARDYDGMTGRWLSKDPIGFAGGSANLYTYAMGDPVNRIDPSGLSDIIFDRSNGRITIISDDGTSSISFPAHNNTIRPGGNPMTPESNGPAPNGSFPIGSIINTGGDPDSPFGSGFFPITLPSGPNGQRTGVGLHAGRRNRGGPSANTLGCIRTNEDALDFLRNDPPTHITISD